MNSTSYIPILHISLSPASFLCPCNLPPNETMFKRKSKTKTKQLKTKIENKQINNKNKIKNKPNLKNIITKRRRISSWKLCCGLSSHRFPFSPFAFIHKFHRCESLSGSRILASAVDNGLSFGLLMDILLLSWVVQMLQFGICRFVPFMCSNSPEMMWLLGGFIALVLGLGINWVGLPTSVSQFSPPVWALRHFFSQSTHCNLQKVAGPVLFFSDLQVQLTYTTRASSTLLLR